ncbi:MAG: hypothetical protein U5K27_10085 [Desulfotignum sp.]|nr:hypothetical protein [Desulfotignum sp.]
MLIPSGGAIPKALLGKNIEAVNQGLAYTIHRFSSHFQNMHETYLKDYARRLEKDVAARTSDAQGIRTAVPAPGGGDPGRIPVLSGKRSNT